MDMLADSVVYTNRIIRAMVVYANQNVTIQDSYLTTPQIQITALKKDVLNVARGSVFDHQGRRLVVDSTINDTETHVTLSANYD